MSKNVIFVLKYHRNKPLDHIIPQLTQGIPKLGGNVARPAAFGEGRGVRNGKLILTQQGSSYILEFNEM
jgi:hypothetical protein